MLFLFYQHDTAIFVRFMPATDAFVDHQDGDSTRSSRSRMQGEEIPGMGLFGRLPGGRVVLSNIW